MRHNNVKGILITPGAELDHPHEPAGCVSYIMGRITAEWSLP